MTKYQVVTIAPDGERLPSGILHSTKGIAEMFRQWAEEEYPKFSYVVEPIEAPAYADILTDDGVFLEA